MKISHDCEVFFGNPTIACEYISMDMNKKIANYAYACGGEWAKIASMISNNSYVKDYGVKEKYITVFDECYPDCLRALRYPPWILFYEGNIELLKDPKITIIGSRNLSDYGKEMTELSAKILSQRFTVVSGMAKGADALAHMSAIKKGRSIGVVGSGLNTHYPKENEELYRVMKKDHLVLSEYPCFVGVKKHHFPWRNRILAALGEYCIVSEAALRSGTMLTVNEAMELGKEVYCFPHPLHIGGGSGCNKLIEDGVHIIYDIEQLRQLVPKKRDVSSLTQ